MTLRKKMMLLITLLLTMSLTGIVLVASMQSQKYLLETAKADLAHLTGQTRMICEISANELNERVKSNLAMAKNMFEAIGGNRITVSNGQMLLETNGTSDAINGDTRYVDKISSLTGARCTIFLKEGSRAKRIATSVVDASGKRAIGTFLSDAVYDAVFNKKQQFIGRAWVVDGWYLSAYEPLRDKNGEVVGALFCGLPERSGLLRKDLMAIKVGQTGYIFAVDSKGVLQLHPAKEGEDISQNDFIKEMTSKARTLTEGEVGWITYNWMNKELGETKSREKIVAYTYFPDWDWVIGVGSYLDEFTAPVKKIKYASIFLGILFLASGLTAAFFVSRSITNPIRQVVATTDEMCREFTELDRVVSAMANNDFTQQIKASHIQRTGSKSNDETGILIRSVENALDSKDRIFESLRTMSVNVTNVIAQLSDRAVQLVSTSTGMASTADNLARGSEEQTHQTTQVSSAIEEMTSTIVEASKNAGDAAGQAKQAAEAAQQGNDVVAHTIEGMNRIATVVQESAHTIQKLSKSSDQIGEIATVINDIADQTNLLALNAAIEAARAGEQGRGFAVVADEVRKLAERTTKATAEITTMIKTIQGETRGAVTAMEQGINEVQAGRELADQAGDSLQSIGEYAQRVMDMVRQIATAAEQQSAASEQIAKSVVRISQVTKTNASEVKLSADAAEQLNKQAEDLRTMVSQFKIVGGGIGIINLARNDHKLYMEKLKKVIDGVTDIALWKVVDGTSCRFGKWYHGPDGRQYTGMPEYEAVNSPHNQVHSHGNQAVQALKDGNHSLAMRHYQQALEASHQVIANLERLSDAVKSQARAIMGA